MPKVKSPETPKERLELAKRYLRNAKEILKKAGVDKKAGRYEDIKYIVEASATAYAGALEALKSLFLWEGLIDDTKKLKKVQRFYELLSRSTRLGKDRDLLLKLFDDVYTLLHVSAYYRELQNKKSIDAGFEQVERIIRIVERHINGRP